MNKRGEVLTIICLVVFIATWLSVAAAKRVAARERNTLQNHAKGVAVEVVG